MSLNCNHIKVDRTFLNEDTQFVILAHSFKISSVHMYSRQIQILLVVYFTVFKQKIHPSSVSYMLHYNRFRYIIYKHYYYWGTSLKRELRLRSVFLGSLQPLERQLLECQRLLECQWLAVWHNLRLKCVILLAFVGSISSRDKKFLMVKRFNFY